MKRAAVLVGVDQTGNLPKLKDAAKGARRMEEWARSQKIDPIIVFTDEGGKRLLLQDIKDAVKAIVDRGLTEQLIIYFAGHGLNIGYGERWLLTDAPADTNAAVNLNGSAELAHHCGIPHVVLVSDACRTAADGIAAQGVSGGEIFPNAAAGGPEGAVDRFWACLVGNPAAEVRDPNTTAGEYRALYTGVLLDALRGNHAQVVQPDGADGVVRPRPLKQFLLGEMGARIKGLNLKTELIQTPDARITSEETVWISRLPAFRKSQTRRGTIAKPKAVENLETISTSLFRAAVSRGVPFLLDELESSRSGNVANARLLVDSIEKSSEPFGPEHFETQCGFKVRGARFVDSFAGGARAELLGSDGSLVRVDSINGPGASVLLVFKGGAGAVLPAIPGFIAALTVEQGGLIDVAYEPSDNTWRWSEFVQRAHEVRALRAIAASSTRSGVFRLESSDDALAVARRMQYAKGLDPSLAIYAAYAYNDIRRRERIREMNRYMRDDLGARLFDIAMLAGDLDDKDVVTDREVLPFLPLLSQGWALLSARRVRLPAALGNFQRTLLPSVWTMFDVDGVNEIQGVIQSGEVR